MGVPADLERVLHKGLRLLELAGKHCEHRAGNQDVRQLRRLTQPVRSIGHLLELGLGGDEVSEAD
jgi:hypothetical protein